jgi:hypothetical protein
MPKTKKEIFAVIIIPLEATPGTVSSVSSEKLFTISLDKPWLLAIAGLLLGIYKIHNFNKKSDR